MSFINAGLWLSPKGDYTRVRTNHVADIISEPSKYGVTSKFIQGLYGKHNERMGVEGRAREELILLVLRTGWVRIRNYRNYWSVTVDRLTRRVSTNIRNWVETFMQNGSMGKYEDIKIYEAVRDRLTTHSATDIVHKYVLEESQQKETNVMLITETKLENLPDIELLTEVKLSRVYNIFTNPDIAVGMITAFRGDKSLDENVRNNKQVAAQLRSAGFGYNWIDGAWIENKGTEDENHVAEVSILVTSDFKNQDKLFNILTSVSKKYNQDAFVFKRAINKEKTETEAVKLFDKSGKELMKFNGIRMDQIADNYSRLRSGGHAGRSFIFESIRDPVGFFGRLAGMSDDVEINTFKQYLANS